MDTQLQIDKLRKDLNDLIDEMYLNNFTGYQVFTKYADFTNRIKVPVVSALPANCEIGELVVYNAKLYFGSALNTWTATT